MKDANSGRIGVKTASVGLAKSKRFQQSRRDRKHQIGQIRENKKAKILEAKRAIGGPGKFAPPLLTAIINLNDNDANISKWLINRLTSCDESAVTVTKSQTNNVSGSEEDNCITHLSFPRFKRRFAFVTPDRNNLHAVLDAAKVCDCIIFLLSSNKLFNIEDENVMVGDGIGNNLFSSIVSQGIPADPVFVLSHKSVSDATDITDISSKTIKKNEAVIMKNYDKMKKQCLKSIQKRYPNIDKIYSLGQNASSTQDQAESLLILRHLSIQKRRLNSLRDHRPHLMAESVTFNSSSVIAGKGNLVVQGYIRCGGGIHSLSWSVNRLVHIPGWGDFQVSHIDGKPDPHPLVGDRSKLENKKSKEKNENYATMDEDGPQNEIQTIAIANPDIQEPLIFENEPDIMDGEQTWPTEEELNEAAFNQSQGSKRLVRVPKGMGEYQAAWIIDHEQLEEGNASEDDSLDEFMEDDAQEENEVFAQSQENSDNENGVDGEEYYKDEEYETISISNGGTFDNYDEKQDSGCKTLAEEQEAWLKLKAAREDAMFPDEIDTPLDVPAKLRFARYRGLKSFRTSPWDAKENLPFEYAKIFQFENFENTKKRVFADLKKERKVQDETRDDRVSVGTYVVLHIKDVPTHLYNEWCKEGPSKNPLVIFNILPHEQKMCVLNFVIKRSKPDSSNMELDVIKSKEKLIFHVGFRRFTACPIFSQHTNGDKHKYVRFWHQDEIIVMTTYAPIMFPPANVLVYKDDNQMSLIGSGSLFSADPNRKIIKRVVLSGHPFKVHKKSAVVRFMFFNREDIEWFKPVELRTKRGRRGHIKEPLGTHGHMKVMFDGSITQQDTILMNLYKRVYPKWNYNSCVLLSDYKKDYSESLAFETGDKLQLTKKKKDNVDVLME